MWMCNNYLFIFILLFCLCNCKVPFDTTTRIDSGLINGFVLNDLNVTAFHGIPYAKAPVGNLRFKPPQRNEEWGDDVYKAHNFSNVCYTVGKGYFVPGFGEVSEDCLYLNVYIPAGHSKDKDPLPVMVWLHGGGFLVGSGSNPAVAPEPSHLITNGEFIYVSMNYRLGPLGYLAWPNEEGGGVMGLLDQQLALKWVQKNIHAFGGDNTNVTLAGESAGAFSICFHLTAPSSKGLFQRVIMMSAICDWDFQSLEDAERQAGDLARKLDCSTLECLQSKDPWEIQEALPQKRGLLFFHGVRWFPVLNTNFVPQSPIHAIQAGNAHTTDVLLGSTANEGTLFMLISFPLFVYRGMFTATADNTFKIPGQAEKIKNALPKSWPERRKLSKTFSDMFSCGVLRTAKALVALNAKDDTAEVFLYHFAHVAASLTWPLRGMLGSYHGSELRYVFNVSSRIDYETETEIVEQMGHYWSRFIHSGNANKNFLHAYSHTAPHWPEFEINKQLYFTFNSTSPEHKHIHTAHAHEDSKKIPVTEVFEDDNEKSPYALCHFYDQFLTRDDLLPPVGEFEEPLYSYVFNVLFIRLLRNHYYIVGSVLLFLILLLIRYCCCCCCYKDKNKTRKIKNQ